MNINKLAQKISKLTCAALIGALLASNALTGFSNFKFQTSNSVYAVDGSGPDISLNNYSVANESNPGAGYQTNITAAVGDFLDVYMEAQNKNVPSDASNLVVKSYFPNFQGGTLTTTGNVSTTTTCSTAGCKTSDTKTATINIPDTARLIYQPGSARVTADLNQDGTNELNGSVLSDNLVMSADGANLGTLKGGSATVQISYRIAVVSAANPNLTVRFLAKNMSRTGTDWAASADASKDETVKFYLELHNTQVGSSAKNVRIKATIPADFATTSNVVLNVTSDNAAAVSGTATVNFAKLSKLLTVPGSTRLIWDINGDGSREYNDTAWSNEDLFGNGIVLPQDLNGCNQFILQLTFLTTVNEKPETVCAGSIGDFVWNDANKNGIQDSGELGIAGVTVTLKNASGTVIATTTTDSNGAYHFNNLCAATYTVTVTNPSGYTATTTNASGSTTANDSNPSPSTVVLTANNSVDNTIDFGFFQTVTCTGSIGDFVWNDTNGNGIQDSGEAGISGVTVSLKSAGGTLISTTTTDASGIYHFNNLCAATYIVEVSGPSGYTATIVNASGSTTANDSNPNPSTVVLTANNSVDNTIDFGFKRNAETGTPNCSLTKKIRLPNGNEQGSVGSSDHIFAPGEQIVYRLFVSNPGNADASSASISDFLPPYLTWVSGDGGYASAENKVNFDLGTLKAGESRTLTYTVKVRSEIPSGQVNQVNNAKFTSPASFSGCTSTSTLVIGKPGAILAAAALPQTGTIPPSILATLGLVLTGLVVRLKKAKVYKYR